MQRRLLFLIGTLMLITQALFAQNCPTNPTYKNTSGTYDLSAGRSLVLNDGKKYKVTIINNFSATSTICVTNGSTLDLSFSVVNFAAAGGSIYIDGTSTISLAGTLTNFPFTLNNYGTVSQDADIVFTNGAVVNNYGTYTTAKSIIVNGATVAFNNSGKMDLSGSTNFNSTTFTITNTKNGTLTFTKDAVFNFGDITNKGTINFNATTTCNSIDLSNSGTVNFTGVLMINVGSITNYGLLVAKGGITINNGVSVNNYCTILDDKDFTFNAGNLNNYGNLLLKTNTPSSFVIQSNFVNGPNGFVQGYDFTSNGNISGGGNFYFQHSTLNNGTFKGTAPGSINFYDATNTTTKFFDVQNIAPQNTTKNPISPITTTSFVACGDPAPPAITTQPVSVDLCSNSSTSATFSVVAYSPYSAMTYQWRKNGVNISGATGSSYTASNLTLADTANVYTVAVTNNLGTTISNGVYVNYIIVAQPSPASLYLAAGSNATFTIKTSGATAWQWQKNGANVANATSYSYNISAVKLTDAGSYTTLVTYNGGTCTSNVATLNVENTPVINTQPQLQVLCTGTTSATFNVAATSISALSYQWYKNGAPISGANASSYTATGLAFKDTTNTYYVVLTNGVGSTTSSSAGLKYLIISQPASQYVATGTAVTFSVTTSTVATGYQWQKNGVNIPGAKSRTYTIASAAPADAGNYSVVVSYSGGSCSSNTATLTVENLPVIATQPQLQVLCNNSTTTATYSVAATSTSALSYQWFKNGNMISGANASSYTATGLTYNDTTNNYSVVITNGVGSVTSNNAGLKYLIIAQPSPATAYLATGNSINFTATASAVASAFQWKKNGTAIPGATGLSYQINPVTTTSAGSYTLAVSYSGGTCTSNAAVLQTSIVLYSKANGNMNTPATWGVNTDGTGSTPVDFTRDEHTFVVANRISIANTSNLSIAGKLDLNNGVVTIAPGTTLTAGRIVRSGTTGVIAGSATSSLSVQGISTAAYTGSSDLYFQSGNNVLQYLTIAGHAVTLRSALDLTAGSNPGRLVVNSGSFNTSDLLTLKSDIAGTAIVGLSLGTITGKATVERFIPARRAWRLICAPITSVNAPTINAAWQEGATGNTDNPSPGYGTHITYGAVTDGFDQNPQKTFSMYAFSGGNWIGVPATNQTPVTNYTGYLFFIRGNRSYDIINTTSSTTPSATTLRTKGYLKQGQQPGISVSSTGFTLIANPFASPIDFEQVYNSSLNIKHTIRVWDPLLAGTKGVGAYVTLDWTGTAYKPTPPSSMNSIIQPYQAFFVQGLASATGSVNIGEASKNVTTSKNPFGRVMARENNTDAMLEVNLRVFNEDGTTGIADGVLYRFNNAHNNDVDEEDVVKLNNLYENLSIKNNNTLLTIERRQLPGVSDTLQLGLTGTKSTNYQLEFVPEGISGTLFLYDRLMNTLSPISTTDTTHVTISINTADAASKDANRFSIVGPQQVVLPVSFIVAKAYAKGKTAQVEWQVANDGEVKYYEVEKSTDGATFSNAGTVKTGSSKYSFTDMTPVSGDNFYRIKSVGFSGEVKYSDIMLVNMNSNESSYISLYPNPITGKTLHVQLSNKSAGAYVLTILTSLGKQVIRQNINYNGGTATYDIQLKNNLASGVYFVKATGPDGSTSVIKAIVQ